METWRLLVLVIGELAVQLAVLVKLDGFDAQGVGFGQNMLQVGRQLEEVLPGALVAFLEPAAPADDQVAVVAGDEIVPFLPLGQVLQVAECGRVRCPVLSTRVL